MIIFLRVLFILVLLSMLAVTSGASLHVSVLEIPRDVLHHPWFIATLVDAYWAFITFYVWVAWKETLLLPRMLWFVAIIALGNIAMSLYLLRELFRLPARSDVSVVFMQRLNGGTALPAIVAALGNLRLLRRMNDERGILLGVAGLATCATFGAVYWLARRINNYSIVDIAWSYAFTGVALFYALASAGWPVRRALIAIMVGGWSLRLGTHLLLRIASHHPVEDARYTTLRRDWAGRFELKMFGFFQLQAVSVVVLSIAFLLPALNGNPQLHFLEIAGIALWLVAISGESIADAQLAAFKRDPVTRGQVCDRGLWRYSRHPNYFFEWLIWVAFFIFALSSPWGWLAAIGPVAILVLVLKVTGIPIAEAQSLGSKGNAYRRYQEVTSAFVPMPRKK